MRRCGRSSRAGRGRRSRSSRRGGCRRRCARSPRRSPDRPVAVCRELTKQFEEVVRGPAAEVADAVLGAAEGRDHARRRAGGGASSDDSAAAAAVGELVAAGSAPPAGGRSRLPADRRAPERALPAISVTRHARKCDKTVTSIDNGGEPRPTVDACCLSREPSPPRRSCSSCSRPPPARGHGPRRGPVLAAVPPRQQPVRRRAAPRNRHRWRSRLAGRRAAGRNGHVRRRRCRRAA